MSENRYEISQAQVFTKDTPTSPWVLASRLFPQTATRSTSSRGTAEFVVARAVRTKRDTFGLVVNTDDPLPVVGARICILLGSGTPDTGNVIWYGEIAELNLSRYSDGSDDQSGTLSAVEIGTVWSANPLRGWLRVTNTSGTGLAVMDQVPTANLATAGGGIIGNRFDSVSVIAFESNPAATETLWSKNQIIQHTLDNCLPGGEVVVLLDDQTTTPALSDITNPDAYELRGRTMTQVLDDLCGPGRGFTWNAEYRGATDDIAIVVRNSTPTVYTDIELGNEAFDLRTVDTPIYDEVEIQGGPIVWCGTLSADGANDGDSLGSLKSGWDSTAENTFLTGKPSDLGGSKTIRGSSECADVFVRFEPKIDNTTGPLALRCSDGAAGVQLMCPEVEWNGVTATIGTADRSPYLLTSRFLRWIPQPTGTDNTGTDTRNNSAKNASPYMPMQAFVDRGVSEDPRFIDVRNPDPELNLSRPLDIPTLGPDDRSLALRVKYPNPELIAATEWAAFTDPGPSDRNPDDVPEAYDWRNLYVTAAVNGGQSVLVSERRSGVALGDVRRRLVIERPQFQHWIIRGGTILYIDADGALAKAAGDTVIRDDWSKAQALLDQVTGYAFASKTSFEVNIADVDSVSTLPWAILGGGIGAVTVDDTAGGTTTEDVVSFQSNTVVSMISYDLSVETPRVTIGTVDPGIWLDSRSTVPAASLANLQQRVALIESDTATLPARQDIPLTGGGGPDPDTIVINGGQLLGTYNTVPYYGIKRLGTALTTLPAGTYDPGTVNALTGAELTSPTPAIGSWPDGLGFGVIGEPGSFSRVIVVNDVSVPYPRALRGNTSTNTILQPYCSVALSIATRSIEVTGGDPITAYVPLYA